MENNTIAIMSFFPWLIVKIAIMVLVFCYIVFAALIVRQEQLMNRVVEIPVFPVLRLVAIAHLIASVTVFVLALVLL